MRSIYSTDSVSMQQLGWRYTQGESSWSHIPCAGNGTLVARTVARHRQVHDLPNQLSVGAPRGLRGHRKLLLARKPRVGVCFNHVHLTFWREAHIDTTIVAQLYGTVCGQSCFSETGCR